MTAILELTAEVTSIEFDHRSLFARMVEAEQKPLASVAALLESTAKSLVFGSRRKSPNELTPQERRSVFAGNPLPWAHSRPGEPPRSPTRRFRDSILGAVDPGTQSALAGATGGGRLPRTLEFGGQMNGHHIAPRPLMQPTLQRSLSKIPSMFEGIL